MSDLCKYAIAAYFRIFLPHISRLHGPHILNKFPRFSDMPSCIRDTLSAMVGAAAEMDEAGDGETDRYDYKYMMNRDKRRWAKADQDGDGLLSKAEFSDFLHPEEVEHMKDVVIDVSMETRPLIALHSRHVRSLCFHGQTRPMFFLFRK